jgi:uncharacterized protein (DUF2132 family)
VLYSVTILCGSLAVSLAVSLAGQMASSGDSRDLQKFSLRQSMIEEQKNNPLHGVKLEALLTDLVDHYGWEVLASEININCFKSNPSIKSSLKFLRRTEWAREKVEGFYLYKFKRLPKPDDVQYELPPRDRIVPLDQKPRSPAEIKPRDRDAEPARTKPAAQGPVSSSPYGKSSGAPKVHKDRPAKATEKPAGNDAWSNWRNKSK